MYVLNIRLNCRGSVKPCPPQFGQTGVVGLEVVLAEPPVAALALDERVVEARDVAGRLPHLAAT